jgi:hypothetical protein
VLKRLDAPVEIRFYSVLDPASVPNSLPAFAARVDQLLAEYQQTANGKIVVTRFKSPSNATSTAASADGIRPFNLDKGDACYLGLTVVQKDHKESLPQLFPEWEQALESDLTRAMVRLIDMNLPARSATGMSATDKAAAEEVKQAIPNLASVSLEEGTRILREAALKELKAAANEMETQVKEAQQRLNLAQTGKSEADQQAAMNHLQRVQAEQGEKLKEIAARLKAQTEAWQRLKETPDQPAPGAK